MTGADDWTQGDHDQGISRSCKQHYEMLGAGDKVMARAMVQFPHNYNYVSREVMYQWFNKHLQMGLPEPVIEEDYRPLSIAEMTRVGRGPSAPDGGRGLRARSAGRMTEDADAQIAALTPHDATSWSQISRGGGRGDRRDRGPRASAGRHRSRPSSSASQRSRRLAGDQPRWSAMPAEERRTAGRYPAAQDRGTAGRSSGSASRARRGSTATTASWSPKPASCWPRAPRSSPPTCSIKESFWPTANR